MKRTNRNKSKLWLTGSAFSVDSVSSSVSSSFSKSIFSSFSSSFSSLFFRVLFVGVCSVMAGLPALLLAGCGVGQLQTARPTPRGKVDLAVGTGFVHNENISARDGSITFSNLPIIVNTRWGLSERVDLGVRWFFLMGMAADAKVNLMPYYHPFALSLSGGIGMAHDRGYGPVLNIPVAVHASYDFPKGITPYAAVGYSAFWILQPKERSDEGLNEGESYVDAKGYGSGLLTVNAGISLDLSKHVALLLEYNFMHQVVNDPGDTYTFIDNHIFLGGIRFRWAL